MRASPNAMLLLSLRSIVALVCLLAFFVTSAPCLHTLAHPQAACSHCTHSTPNGQNMPSCCNATHHPPASFLSADLHQPAQLVAAVADRSTMPLLPFTPVPTQASETPPRPPLISLRI